MKYRCKLCNRDPFILGQYFMVHDELWNKVCLDNNIPIKSLICRSCFEKLLGRRLRETDLTNCLLNHVHKKYILRTEMNRKELIDAFIRHCSDMFPYNDPDYERKLLEAAESYADEMLDPHSDQIN